MKYLIREILFKLTYKINLLMAAKYTFDSVNKVDVNIYLYVIKYLTYITESSKLLHKKNQEIANILY